MSRVSVAINCVPGRGVYSRRIRAHRMAITLEAVHAVDALHEAYRRFAKPDILNTDQGSQFTAQEFVDAFLGN